MSENRDHIGPLDNPELKKSVFQVPEGYFDSLEERLKKPMESEGTFEHNEHLKTSVFETPEGYFDNLESRITESINTKRTLDQEAVQNTPIFEVPAGYFDTFESRLKDRLKAEQEDVKVVPLYQRNWFKFAVAAVLILGFFLLKGFTHSPVITLDDLSEETMEAYLFDANYSDLDLIASVDGFDMVIDDILTDETSGYDFELGLNPELEYDFEYLEQ